MFGLVWLGLVRCPLAQRLQYVILLTQLTKLTQLTLKSQWSKVIFISHRSSSFIINYLLFTQLDVVSCNERFGRMRYFQSALYHSWSVGKSSVRFLLCPQIPFESSFELSNIHGSYVVLCRLTWSASVRFVCCVLAMPWFEMFSSSNTEFYGRILLFGSWFDRRKVSDM